MKIQYVAYDGAIFDTQTECEAHEAQFFLPYITKFDYNGNIMSSPSTEWGLFFKINKRMPKEVYYDLLENLKSDAIKENYPFDEGEFENTPSIYFWTEDTGYTRMPDWTFDKF